MADKQLWQVTPVAIDVKNDDGVIIGGQTAGTRYAPLTLIANFVHNLWAAFINALTPIKTSFANGDKIPVVNGSTATAMEASKLLELTAQNALAGNVAPEFDSSKPNDEDGYAYYSGTNVTYGGKNYVFIVNHSSGAWNPDEVEQRPLSESIHIEGVGEAVNEWLNEHPEATTTVVDGSLTEQKFSDALKLKTIKDYITPEMFGAKGDGVTDDTESIKAWITHPVLLARGTYKVDIDNAYLNLLDGQILDLKGSHFINVSSGGFFKGNGVKNVIIDGGRLTGASGHGTGYQNILLYNAEDCVIQNVYTENAASCGIRLTSCKNITIENCVCDHNCDFGIESHYGENNKFVRNKLTYNGYDLEGTEYTYGRGIIVTREKNALISENDVRYNAEYGIRIYSASADSVTSNNNKIINNNLEDNGSLTKTTRNEIYIYDEGLNKVYDTIVSGNTITRTYEGAFIANSGERSLIQNNILINSSGSSGFSGMAAFVLYGARNTTIQGNIVKDVDTFVSLSGTALCTDTLISDNTATCNKIATSMYGTRTILKGNKFDSYNPNSANNNGIVTDFAVDGYICDNVIKGFYQGMVTSDNGPLIKGNITLDSGNTGLRKYGKSCKQIMDNAFDSSYPSITGTARGVEIGYGRKIVFANSYPTDGNWKAGSICFNSNPTAGYPMGWICTADGEPGTWKELANIQA